MVAWQYNVCVIYGCIKNVSVLWYKIIIVYLTYVYVFPKKTYLSASRGISLGEQFKGKESIPMIAHCHIWKVVDYLLMYTLHSPFFCKLSGLPHSMVIGAGLLRQRTRQKSMTLSWHILLLWEFQEVADTLSHFPKQKIVFWIYLFRWVFLCE